MTFLFVIEILVLVSSLFLFFVVGFLERIQLYRYRFIRILRCFGFACVGAIYRLLPYLSQVVELVIDAYCVSDYSFDILVRSTFYNFVLDIWLQSSLE